MLAKERTARYLNSRSIINFCYPTEIAARTRKLAVGYGDVTNRIVLIRNTPNIKRRVGSHAIIRDQSHIRRRDPLSAIENSQTTTPYNTNDIANRAVDGTVARDTIRLSISPRLIYGDALNRDILYAGLQGESMDIPIFQVDPLDCDVLSADVTASQSDAFIPNPLIPP